MAPPREPSPDQFETEARSALAALPAPFAQYLGDIVLKIDEFADPQALAAVGLTDKWQLSGLYHGLPLSERSVWAAGEMPPTVTLYRQPLLAEMRADGVAFDDLVRHVVVHEIGHHFGLSDADMHALEDDAD